MKHSYAFLLTALLLLPAFDDARAQEEEWIRTPFRWTVSADAGLGMPLQPGAFGDLWNASFPVTVALGYVIIPQVEVKGWLTYAKWGISEIPAKEHMELPPSTGQGVTEISGGSITTLLYGASARIVPLPNSRMNPFLEVGGGFFQASGEDVTVTLDNNPQFTNDMADASGPVLQLALGMEYGINEVWNVYAEANYYVGFDETFAPGDLVRPEGEPRTEGGNLQFLTIVLGIVLKI
jgi:hypothetical protein